jgi:uncharacterized membrane protein YeiH
MTLLVLLADLAGTAVFAVEGAQAGIDGDLDLFGVLVLGFSTALVGGLVRDVLIGAVPPASLRDWRYPTIAFAAAGCCFALDGIDGRIPPQAVTILDAGGLALFAVAGTEKALAAGLHPLPCVLLGAVTAVGGGTLRDMLLATIPQILRVDIYATAALAGGFVLVLARKLKCPPVLAAFAGGGGCFALRMVAISQHWELPHAP